MRPVRHPASVLRRARCACSTATSRCGEMPREPRGRCSIAAVTAASGYRWAASPVTRSSAGCMAGATTRPDDVCRSPRCVAHVCRRSSRSRRSRAPRPTATSGYGWGGPGRGRAARPASPEFAGRSWLQGSLDMRCAAARGVEINLDGAHVYFVHPSHPATVSFRASADVLCDAQQELRVTDRGLVVFWPPVGSVTETIPDTASRIEFELPYTVRFANRTRLADAGHAVRADRRGQLPDGIHDVARTAGRAPGGMDRTNS